MPNLSTKHEIMRYNSHFSIIWLALLSHPTLLDLRFFMYKVNGLGEIIIFEGGTLH